MSEPLDEARRLTRLQIKERGLAKAKVNDKVYRVPGPYVPTPEHEARAARILDLRRRAAR